MSAQQVEEQYGDARPGPGDATTTMAPVAPAEAPTAVEVRRNAALGAGVGVAAAAVGIGWLARAAGSGSPLDWAVCALMAVLAVVFLRSLFDARTPLLVIDELGVRMRLAHQWRGLPWDAVETVAVQPRRGLLRDGRVVVRLHHAERAVEGLDRGARRQAALNTRLYGAPLAVPLGVGTRVVGGTAGELAERVDALSEGRAEVVTLVPVRTAPEPDPSLDVSEPAPALGEPVVGLQGDDIEDADVLDEPAPEAGRAAGGARLRRARWLRRSSIADDDPTDDPTDEAELDEPELDQPEVPAYRAGTPTAASTSAVRRSGATAYVGEPGEDERVGEDHADAADSPTAPVALRRIGEVTTAVTTAVTGAVADAVTKAAAPVRDREGADSTVRSIARLGEPVAPLVIDDFRPEPAYDPVIGPELAAARTRVGLTVDELADRTRIRPHVIESVEVDDFAPCGGDFYARGHIRTLARVLGKDPVPLLERFEERYASAPVSARTVFEAELSTGRVAGLRRTSGGPNWALLVGAVLALVIVWSLVRLLAGTGEEVLEDPPPMLSSQGVLSAPLEPGPGAAEAAVASAGGLDAR